MSILGEAVSFGTAVPIVPMRKLRQRESYLCLFDPCMCPHAGLRGVHDDLDMFSDLMRATAVLVSLLKVRMLVS